MQALVDPRDESALLGLDLSIDALIFLGERLFVLELGPRFVGWQREIARWLEGLEQARGDAFKHPGMSGEVSLMAATGNDPPIAF